MTSGMNDNAPRSRTRFNANYFAGGAGGGGLLFLILSLATGNPVLGVLFGLLPGVAIGLWLALTSRD